MYPSGRYLPETLSFQKPNLCNEGFRLSFNLIVSQRLARKITPTALQTVDIRTLEPELYSHAKNALEAYPPVALEQEMQLRWISQNTMDAFLRDGKIAGIVVHEDTAYKWRIWLYEMLEFDDEE